LDQLQLAFIGVVDRSFQAIFHQAYEESSRLHLQ
jgi:hypothetical protein